ncbi:MAG: serine hydrolase domain-containing protein [Pseudomonadota bacterium]|nr:serine hydrolase domain-containing protein [Pseudomonadota bacterium]
MPKTFKRILSTLAGVRLRIAILSFFSLLLISTGLYSLLITFPALADAAATLDFHEDFQAALDGFQEEYGFPGATAAYVLRDGTTGVVATGLADVEDGTLMTVRSRMLTASIGKTFVGATVLALAREGVLDLDAPVSRWLGDRQWFARLPNHAAMTIRHLLNHTSGLPDHVHLESFATEVFLRWREKHNPFSPEDLIGFVLDLPPLFKVGEAWSYSDTGYILLGLVIEAATGRSYYEEIRERFLTPLDLTLTEPSDRQLLPGLAAGYMEAENAFGFPRKTIQANGMMVWHPGFEWTGGGLVSNSLDLAKWGALLFGGTTMPGDYLKELLRGVQVSPDNISIFYGAGVGIYRSGPFGPVYGHGGWIPGYSSSLRYYLDYGVTVAFQINTDVGIVDDSTTVISEMEERLAQVAISASNAMHSSRNKSHGRGDAKFLIFLYLFLAILGFAFFVLFAIRLWDGRADRLEWKRLAALQPHNPDNYDPVMVADLPEPARRFFNFAITPGASLLTVAEIDMGGQFSLGTRQAPNYQQMNAKQILAAPSGFVWKLRLPGIVPVSGSDSGRWTRFRIFGLFPVARMGGNSDHSRAAYGRYVAEALFWTPATFLPGPGVVWKKVGENTARVIVNHMGLSQTVDLKVDGDGQPVEVYFMRWSDANPEKKYQLQPFGGSLSDFREVQGFHIPFNVEAANMFGTENHFVFFKAEVVSIRFPLYGS